MHCISPIKAGYSLTGDLKFNNTALSKELVGLQFECRKCLPCLLNVAREKAIRAWHESQMHDNSMFLTLTYSDDHLLSPKLIYKDFQDFMKKLRKSTNNKINYIVTGEYGEKNKRPHWHALIFNYRPTDITKSHFTDRGDQIYTSPLIDKLWGRNDPESCPSQIGEVTIDSAGYVARYASKKLVHGKNGTHEYNPIHKTSSRRAIGRSWIEANCKHTFENGFIVLPNGIPSKIPRYYIDWAKEHRTDLWKKYVTEIRPQIQQKAELKQRKEELDYFSELANYNGSAKYPMTRAKVKETILKSKFKRLMEKLKL